MGPVAPPPPLLLYLPHLDGMRAVALMGVLLFHLPKLPLAPGGFLGVDVFLVLSGFLISRNIFRDANRGILSLRVFYVRRFWRLYPAALAVIAAALLASFALFPPELALPVAKSALSAMALSSNIFFHSQHGYFSTDSELQPLLHTWSLSIEEQFYLLWPPVLAAVTSLSPSTPSTPPSRRVAVQILLAALAPASLVAAIVHQSVSPTAVFYLLPFRAYQFAAGAACAVLEPRWRPVAKPSPLIRAFRAIVNTLAVVVIIAAFRRAHSIYAARCAPLVVLAAALVIVTPDAPASRLLFAARPVRYLGHLSYAAYLVHWPICVFVRHTSEGLGFSPPSVPILIALTFVAAVQLRNHVEHPIRKDLNTRRRAVPWAMLFCGVFAYSGVITSGWRFQFLDSDVPASVPRMKKDFGRLCVKRKHTRHGTLEGSSKDFLAARSCLVGDMNGTESSVLLIGDSFARHLIGALDVSGKRTKQRHKVFYRPGCALRPRHDSRKKKCEKDHKRQWKLLDSLPSNSTILAASRWGFKWPNRRRKTLTTLVDELQGLGHRVILAGEPPELAARENWRFACQDLQSCLLWRVLAHSISKFLGKKQRNCAGDWLEPMRRGNGAKLGHSEIFAGPRARPGSLFIDVYDSMCKGSPDSADVLCRTPLDETGTHRVIGYERDGIHLSLEGSRGLADIYENALVTSNAQLSTG